MIEIETFPFEKDKFDQIKNFHYGLNLMGTPNFGATF